MRSEKLYLVDIIEAADEIAEFTAGLEEKDFLSDRLRQSAVLQKLVVIGEAAARLSKEFRQRYPEIEWGDIVAFRNVVIHSYFSVKFPLIWQAAIKDAPVLRQQVAQILEQEFGLQL